MDVGFIFGFCGFLVAIISFWWVNLRGPMITCNDPIRYATIVHFPSSVGIILNFILSNSGGSSATIQYIYLKVRRTKPDTPQLFEFTASFDFGLEKFKEAQALEPNFEFNTVDFPSLPFVIQKGEGVQKDMTFLCENIDSCIKGNYILELYISQQSAAGLLQSLKSSFFGIQKKASPTEIKLLEQPFIIDISLEERNAKMAMIIDPQNANEILKF